MAETVLELRDILVRYGNAIALQVQALELLPGEVLAIIGPNGAGKSTLLRVMGLLQRPYSGTLQFRGKVALGGDLLTLRRRIATVFQEPLLLNATVEENAALGLKLRGVGGREIQRRLGPWLERLGIDQLRARSARTLSGGEAQRTSLARALVLEPEVLLLDEPFAALDSASREALLRDFQSIVRDTRVTTVFVTHDRGEAFELADRLGVLHRGRLLQIGECHDVFRRPATEAVAQIVGVENRLQGVVEHSGGEFATIRVEQIRVKVQGRFECGSRVVVCIRPEEVALGRARCETAYDNQLPGRIVSVSPGMTHQRIVLDCEGTPLIAQLDRNRCRWLALTNGDAIMVTFDSSATHVIANHHQEME